MEENVLPNSSANEWKAVLLGHLEWKKTRKEAINPQQKGG